MGREPPASRESDQRPAGAGPSARGRLAILSAVRRSVVAMCVLSARYPGAGVSDMRRPGGASVSAQAVLFEANPQRSGGAAAVRCGVCSWEFRRSRPPRKSDNLGGCERPSELGCVFCPRVMVKRCGATRDDRCGPCAERHRRDVARVGRSGFNGDRPSGFFFVTLTAPGCDVLRWDVDRCGHAADGSECSGDLGCTVDRIDGGIWNARAPQRWSHFVTELRRRLRCDVQFFGSWETQKRGMLHRHAILWVAPGVTARRVRAAVRVAAPRYGFGRQWKCDPIAGDTARELARKAGYVAKYATKGGDLAVSLDVATGELREGGYRRWSASRRWGQTIASVRAERVAWAIAQAAIRAAVPDAVGLPPGGRCDAAGVALDLDRESYARVGSALGAGVHPV